MSIPGSPAARRPPPSPESNRSLIPALRRRPQLRADLIQLVYIVFGAVVGLLAPLVTGGPTVGSSQVDAVFAGIAGGLIALVSVVYALLFLVIQFGATTHSPRLNLFRDSPLVWHAFGIFVGSIAYVSTALLANPPDQQVSILVPILGLLLVLASLATARRLQLSALRSVQLAPILQDLSVRGREVFDQLYPEPFVEGPAAPVPAPVEMFAVVWPWPPAVLQQIDLPPLIKVAERLDADVRLTVGVGDMLWEREVIIEISARPSTEDEQELLTCIEAGIERSFAQDPLLAFRLLNDVGLRAMSPGINDPYTAVQVLDAIEGLLRRLISRHLDVSVVPGNDGESRVRLSMPTWDDFVGAAVDEFIDSDHGIASVHQRLVTLLNNLTAMSPPSRLPALQRRHARLPKA